MAAASGGSVLVLNSGSSSVKFALVTAETGERVLGGLANRVGTPEAVLRVQRAVGGAASEPLPDGSRTAVITRILDLLAPDTDLIGAGHRVVHGGDRFSASVLVDDDVVAAIRSFAPLAPLQNPANLTGIEAIRAARPALPQVAVFDTAFHQTMPASAFRYAVPEEWYTRHGVRRYGFHGISHRFVSERAAALLGRPLGELRLVTAHLGNGCSAAAIRDGVSVDTTMGLTPLEGLVMGTRSGDIDPGVFAYLAERTGLSAAELTETLNTRSGLLGLSGQATTCGSCRTRPRAATNAPGSPSTSSCTGWPRRSPGWSPAWTGWTRWSSPAASGRTARSSAAWSCAASASSAWPRTRRPTPGTAGPPAAGSAVPARSRRS